MILLERTAVMNWENAMRGARNPMNSWARGDSCYGEDGSYQLGENDLSLALRLCRSGSDHRKFIRQIFVSVDITAPLYWWKEFDTYKVGTVANSTSTMHKIHAKPFSREDFSCDRMDERTLSCLDGVIALLEQLRQDYLADKDKTCWYSAAARELQPAAHRDPQLRKPGGDVLCPPDPQAGRVAHPLRLGQDPALHGRHPAGDRRGVKTPPDAKSEKGLLINDEQSFQFFIE